jgi:hypothetical protein
MMDAADSSKGPVGFCAVNAKGKLAAVARLKELLPIEVEVKVPALESGEYIEIYLTPSAIKSRHIDEAEEAV